MNTCCIAGLWRTLACFFLFLPFFALAQQHVQFNIESKRADRALIEFAQQANQTILFSFDLTSKTQAKALKGVYSVAKGINVLLNQTGLRAVISPTGQLSIESDLSFDTAVDVKPKVSSADEVVSQESSPSPEIVPDSIEKVAILGTRVAGRSADTLPVPVDILSAQALINTGQTEVGRMLQTIAPSFNFSSSAISDGTDALRPATLRGLGPDQTLVLINGKRRHQAGLIHINSSVGRGTAGTDMNAIPAASIKRIEVLRDGAAAQYGSDAIAGVINFVLNDNDSSGTASISYGEYQVGDGGTTNINLSQGFSFGADGFVNAAFNQRKRNATNRAGLHGSCLYASCTPLQNGTFLATESREITASRNTFRIGDADSNQVSVVFNGGHTVGYGEIYGFATYSNRENQSAAFFRHNGNAEGNPRLQDGDATIIHGFLPKINSRIDDVSFNAGYRVDFDNGSSLDLSYTYGQNSIDYHTSDSINASYANALRYDKYFSANQIREVIPREAFAYGLELSLQTINLDFAHNFEGFSLAMGFEVRTDGYQVLPGDEYSYTDYDTKGGSGMYVGLSDGVGSENAAGGIQGFPGIGPTSLVDETRDVLSFYADIESQINDQLMLSSAIRYDDYDGFGNTSNYKLAATWSINNNMLLRSSVSTGFRAPSMQQLYFNDISTQFVVNEQGHIVEEKIGTFRNDSYLAKAIGIPSLKEEESRNWSLGAVVKLASSINLTLDYYAIDIDDRIMISNRLDRGLSDELGTALQDSGATKAQFFFNGVDTETSGIDLVATWGTSAFNGSLDLTLAANYTKTDVVKLFTPQSNDINTLATVDVFSEQDISIIEEWQPESRISLSSLYKSGNWSLNLAFNRYGEYTITDGGKQTYGAELLTDFRAEYQINDNLSLNFGANNMFDVTPDKNTIGNSRAGTIVDRQGNTIVSSTGVFVYSRRSAPFGFNGAYYYTGLEYSF